MAKDFKTLNVPPASESSAIQFWTSFGYELFGNQEVRFSETDVNQNIWTDNIEVTKKDTHYIKLSFQRDTSISHYEELKQLEQEVKNIPEPVEPGMPNGIGKIIIGLLICTIPGIIFIIQNCKYPALMRDYEEKYREYVAKRDAIANRARQLCD
ncbi:hypothetical protein [Ruminococcus sp.]|uniref:hypothetical protein n=1 Tax=Ruminococcus sp. TaxID=41978 RepID=UPI0025FCE495|nr:hypothetical protein [Ruminococcus sp.]